MKRLEEIFEIYNGHGLELINCNEVEDGINYVARTSKTNGITAQIELIENLEPMPANAITVALSGSVLSSFYQDQPFYTAYHVACLYPKQPLATEQMLFYAYIIEQNKYRYSFGRQANKTLKNMLVPDVNEFPDYANKISILDYQFEKEPVVENKIKLNMDKWKWFNIADIFTLEKCKCKNAGELLEDGNDIVYVGAKKKENGFMRNVAIVPELVTKGNCIVFIGDGQGSVGYTTYQPFDFIGSTTLTAGYIQSLNQFNALFLVSVLDLERYRYSFGRKYGCAVVKEKKIKLPAKNGQPDFEFMENYIKALDYSKLI
ncbi:MAG: restriction endonuclease subunit S [Prevotellaceae bacterium]|jgi:hypothetical protein|nr:restriction endonuclease subunit S [Prevotellaceae bacterium]